jgi:plasmid replication initiation protein
VNEIVKIHNDLTNEKLGKMNAKELDLFMTICHKMRDKGTERVVITFDELRKLGNYSATSNKVLKQDIVKANSKLLEFQFLIEKGPKTYQRTLFKDFITDEEECTVTVGMWEETTYILNDIASHFTRFELSEFVSLESKYAKRLYKLIKQYKTQGSFYIAKQDFYIALDVPQSLHRACNFNDRALKPALEECRKYIPSLECVSRRTGRGGAIRGYTFTFSPEVLQKQVIKNKFNDFEQRKLDIDALESSILSN